MKKEEEENEKLQAVRNKKKQISEKYQKDIFESRYLPSQEKAELDILQNYQKKKKIPAGDITLFLKEKGLIVEVKSFAPFTNEQTILDAFSHSYLKRFGELLPLEVYLAVDDQVYPLNYFNNWDQVLPLIQIRIDELRNKAVQERKKELTQQWNALAKEEQNLRLSL